MSLLRTTTSKAASHEGNKGIVSQYSELKARFIVFKAVSLIKYINAHRLVDEHFFCLCCYVLRGINVFIV